MITKPKRKWSKMKDYIRNKTFRALRRKGKRLLQSFDGGSDDELTIVDDGKHGGYIEESNKPIVLTNDPRIATLRPNVFVNNDTGEYTLEQNGKSYPLSVYDKGNTEDRALWTYKLPNGRLVTPHTYGKQLTITPTMEKPLSPVDPVMEMYLSTAVGKPIFDLAGKGIQMVGQKAVGDFLSRCGNTKVGNYMRGRMLSNALNKSVNNWDGTVGAEYFQSPYNWYRWTETPEIQSLRMFGKNITTRDDPARMGTPNGWRNDAMNLFKNSKEGYWYKGNIPEDSDDFFVNIGGNYNDMPIGLLRKSGSAHGNRTQASYGQPWGGSLSTSGISHLGILEGGVGSELPIGRTRSIFRMTPFGKLQTGSRVGFKTGEMPMDNLSWFEKLPNGRFSYEGPVLPDKRIDLGENLTSKQPRLQLEKPTYQVYNGKAFKTSDVIKKDGTVDINKLKEVYREALKHIPNGYTPQHRLENPKWHAADWNTFLHSRDAYRRALESGYPHEALFPTLVHDAGKLWAGDGHGPYGASIIKQMFPDATDEQIMAIYGHMTQEPYGKLGNLVKGVDISTPNKFRDKGLEQMGSDNHNLGKDIHKSFNNGSDDNMSYFDWATKASAYKGIPIQPNQRDFDYYGWYNTPIPPYRGTYGQYAFLKDDPNAHFDDYNKGVFHPTFSTGSRYSGVKNPQFNPFGYKGGVWVNDHKYIEPQHSPVSTDSRIDYLNMAENNGVQLRGYGDKPIWFSDGSRFDGVLPEVVVTPPRRSHNN